MQIDIGDFLIDGQSTGKTKLCKLTLQCKHDPFTTVAQTRLVCGVLSRFGNDFQAHFSGLHCIVAANFELAHLSLCYQS